MTLLHRSRVYWKKLLRDGSRTDALTISGYGPLSGTTYLTDDVITVIKLLSPKNKRSGDGRIAYEKKRRAILGSATHLVELDLLRGGKPMAILGMRSTTAYRILISRSDRRPTADLYNLTLQQKLPLLPIPLKPNEEEPQIPLQDIFNGVYDRARYSTRIDYRQPVPPPALSAIH